VSRTRVALAGLAAATLLAACSYTKEEDDEDAVDAAATTVPGEAATTVPGDVATTTTEVEIDLGSLRLGLEEVAQLDEPVALAARAGDPAIYVAEKGGRVRRIEITTRRNGTQEFTVERTSTMDIADEVLNEGEQGLLGITFSTDGNRLYAAYTGEDAQQHLVEFTMNGEVVSNSSRRDLLTIPDFAPNHNGGMLAFGPDGFLYWAMGDGGGGGDPESTGQDPSDLLGSILRIDPDVAPEQRDEVPYAVPDDNPFVDGGGAPEVWAYGLRNPWRFSFDRGTGDLWIGDVGQNEIEEIDFVPATDGTGAGRGANFGWSAREGDRPFEGGEVPAGAVEPIFAYDRSGGACSVTGGYVYRGLRVPSLIGVYLFADYCEGRLRGITVRNGALADEADLGVEVAQPTSFGQDAEGELYVLSQEGGVFRIVAAS
jgi:glucose/arabinose dehydrogenase